MPLAPLSLCDLPRLRRVFDLFLIVREVVRNVLIGRLVMSSLHRLLSLDGGLGSFPLLTFGPVVAVSTCCDGMELGMAVGEGEGEGKEEGME